MKPDEFLQAVLSKVTEETQKQVLHELIWHMGEAVTRERLVWMIFGVEVVREDLPKDANDRKIREAIHQLRLKGYPIVASSGEAGYALVDDPARIDAYIAEEASRIEEIRAKIDALYRARVMARSLREWRATREPAIQQPLFSLPSTSGK